MKYLIFLIMLVGCNQLDSPGQEIWNYDFTNTYSTDNQMFFNYNLNGEKIELSITKDIKREFAEEIIADDILMFQSLFEQKRTGYPGQYTKYIECPDEFKPQYFEKNLDSGYLKYFIGYANSNYVAGACSSDLIKFKLLRGYIYCDSIKTMINIDYFVPPTETDKIDRFLEKLNCNI